MLLVSIFLTLLIILPYIYVWTQVHWHDFSIDVQLVKIALIARFNIFCFIASLALYQELLMLHNRYVHDCV